MFCGVTLKRELFEPEVGAVVGCCLTVFSAFEQMVLFSYSQGLLMVKEVYSPGPAAAPGALIP